MVNKFELFTVSQEDRVEALQKTVPAWMQELTIHEQLVVGIPAVLGKWDQCTVLVLENVMYERYQAWLRSNARDIEGPCYNLPPLNAGFICAVIDRDFDPRFDAPPSDATEELLGMLASLATWMEEREPQPARS